MTVVHEGGRRRERESLCVCIYTREKKRGKRNRHKTIQRVLKGLGHNMVLAVCVIVCFPCPRDTLLWAEFRWCNVRKDKVASRPTDQKPCRQT